MNLDHEKDPERIRVHLNLLRIFRNMTLSQIFDLYHDVLDEPETEEVMSKMYSVMKGHSIPETTMALIRLLSHSLVIGSTEYQQRFPDDHQKKDREK